MWLTLPYVCVSGAGDRGWHVSYTRREASSNAQSAWTLVVGKRTQHHPGTAQTDGIMTEMGRGLQVAQRREPLERDGLGSGRASS